jgi:hypothetical protein
MKRELAFAGALMALASGCVTLPPGAEPGPNGTMAYHVPIDANEPGVTIRVNGQDVGKTPLTLKIFGDPDGTFHDFGSYEYVVQALPLHTNQFLQTRVFMTGKMFTPEDKIPTEIRFDMNQPPPPTPTYAPGYPPPGYYPPPYYYPYGPYWGYWGGYWGPRPYGSPYYNHHGGGLHVH